MGGMIFTATDQHKSGYNTWHKWNIEILTSNTESTSKTGPDEIQYVTFKVVFCNLKFGNNHEIGSNMAYWQDMREPFSDSTYLYYFGHNSLLIT